jgi:hypothetical protein
LTEAFALHFLEDAFSSGHFVDFNYESNYRNGVHDYYSSHGVDSRSWTGEEHRAFGDAHMTRRDLELASAAVRASLEMVQTALGPDSIQTVSIPGSDQLPRDFDVCTERRPPRWLNAIGSLAELSAAMRQTPQPSVQGRRISSAREYRNDRGINLQVASRNQLQYDIIGNSNGENHWRFRSLGELGIAINFDSIMSGYRDGNIIQIAVLGGYEWGPESGLTGGFRVRLPILSFLYSSVLVPTCPAIRTSVPLYMAMADTRPRFPLGFSTRLSPATSLLVLNIPNINEVSVLWGPRGTQIQIPIIYYLMRGSRPIYTSWEFTPRLEVGVSVEFAHDNNTYLSAFLGFNPTIRTLLTNLGPQ